VDVKERINIGESFIVANDCQFLGKLSLNRYDSESIMNEYGNYGSRFSSTSIFNQYSTYGSKFSSLSPFNPYTSTPPIIYLHGGKYGFLTKNKFLSNQLVDPDRLFEWMRNNNLNY